MSIFDEGLVSLETLYRDNTGRRDPVWQKWGRQWADCKPLAMDKFQSWLQQHGRF